MTAGLTGCSREQQDWRSAEGSDSIDAYNQFLTRHPDSELATQARARVSQLMEDRAWQQAGSVDTADAYRQFLAQHPNGKWAQEARIRLENFSLGGPPSNDPSPRLSTTAATPASGSGALEPGEAATPVGPPPPRPTASVVKTAAPPSPAAAPVVKAAASPSPTAAPAVKAAAAPSPTAATSIRPGTGFGVQLGAFKTQDSANNEWHQLAARFGRQLQGLAPHIVEANTPSGRLFRLQASVGDEARARALCAELKQQSQPCVPVIPR